jgi:hypothetical protein
MGDSVVPKFKIPPSSPEHFLVSNNNTDSKTFSMNELLNSAA